MSQGVYSIRNVVTGICYIGSSSNIEQRWSVHRTHLRRKCHHSSKLQYDWRVYGRRSFSFEIVELVADVKRLCEREEYWISYYDSYHNGYNSTPIATRPRTLTKEERDTRDAIIYIEKLRGTYEPKYIKKIRAEFPPITYDEKAQALWESQYAEIQSKNAEFQKKRTPYAVVGFILILSIFLGGVAFSFMVQPIALDLLPEKRCSDNESSLVN